MQTIELIIPGSYYDSQIYSGILYLWREDGAIEIIKWEKLVDKIISRVSDHLRFALYCGLRKGSYLYGPQWKLFAKDNEMYSLLLARFAELSKEPIIVEEEDINDSLIRIQNNPFAFPHADIRPYYNRIYVASTEGLQVSSFTDDETLDISATKIWDASVFSLSTSHNYLAIAAGSDGLFESELDNQRFKNASFRKRSERSSTFVRWLYPSIYSSSYSGGFLADYAIEKQEVGEGKDTKAERRRVFRDTLPDTKLFQSSSNPDSQPNGYSWGVRDKICFAQNNSIQIVRYVPETPNRKKSDVEFTQLGTELHQKFLDYDVISADSAYFGYVLEMNDGLLVYNSNLESKWLENEPVNWRVFPDTRDYINHLHVVYDDFVKVHSFTHDYFIDQKKKHVGISFSDT